MTSAKDREDLWAYSSMEIRAVCAAFHSVPPHLGMLQYLTGIPLKYFYFLISPVSTPCYQT
jgi:hypothetical protein